MHPTEGVDSGGSHYEKTFWYPYAFRGTWAEAKQICDSFDMGLISLESDAEANHFLAIYERYGPLFDTWTHIGAVATLTKTLTDWFWIENASKLNFTLRFLPGMPDNYGGNEVCLSLTNSAGSYYFNDLKCYENYMQRFICQTVTYVPDPDLTTLPPQTSYREKNFIGF